MDSETEVFGAGMIAGGLGAVLLVGAALWYVWPRDVSYRASETSTTTITDVPRATSSPLTPSVTYLGTGTPPFPVDLATPILPHQIVLATGTLEALQSIPYPMVSQPTTLLATGFATMTASRFGTTHDMFIGDTQLYQTQAQYQLMVRAEDSPIKTMYFTLPDFYRPVDQSVGGDPLIVSIDGQKQIQLRLKHDANVQSDFDATILIQQPMITDEADHPLRIEEEGNDTSVFSVVNGGLSVTIEVSHTPKKIIPEAAYTFAKSKLDASILKAAISI